MKITILTMFPQMFDSFREGPVVQRAIRKGSLELSIIDIKEFAPGSFRHIDDSPFGGGAGMVMRCQPVLDASRTQLLLPYRRLAVSLHRSRHTACRSWIT